MVYGQERIDGHPRVPHILLTVHGTVPTMWALGRQQDIVQHMRALPHGAVAYALATVRASQASFTTKRAFEFLVLTAARSGEVRLATWDEMDLDAGVWTIPAARMKELGVPAMPHGIRSSFRDWAAERTSTPREVVEVALAHTVQNPTEAAYARSDLFERRRRLMTTGRRISTGSRSRNTLSATYIH